MEEEIQGLKMDAVKVADECDKLRAALDTVEKDFNEKLKAALDAVEKELKAESLNALQSGKTELTKEREEAEGKTTVAREAMGTAIRHKCSRVLYCAFVCCLY
jgi:uncharacterized protein with gpF-like domain